MISKCNASNGGQPTGDLELNYSQAFSAEIVEMRYNAENDIMNKNEKNHA